MFCCPGSIRFFTHEFCKCGCHSSAFPRQNPPRRCSFSPASPDDDPRKSWAGTEIAGPVLCPLINWRRLAILRKACQEISESVPRITWTVGNGIETVPLQGVRWPWKLASAGHPEGDNIKPQKGLRHSVTFAASKEVTHCEAVTALDL